MATCSGKPTNSRSQHHRTLTTLLLVAAMAGLAAAAKRLGPPRGGIDWEKRFERMPDNAPPKWMFNNIKAIRQNTDRILELLERSKVTTSEAAPAQHGSPCPWT